MKKYPFLLLINGIVEIQVNHNEIPGLIPVDSWRMIQNQRSVHLV